VSRDVLEGEQGMRTLSSTLEGLRSPWQMSLLCMYCMPETMLRSTPITGRHRSGMRGAVKRPQDSAMRRLPALQYSCEHARVTLCDLTAYRRAVAHARAGACVAAHACAGACVAAETHICARQTVLACA
jgi:hypothetical protein